MSAEEKPSLRPAATPIVGVAKDSVGTDGSMAGAPSASIPSDEPVPVAKEGADENQPEEPINDDDREKYDWKQKYPLEARKMIRVDAIYVSTALALSLVGILLTWRGDLLRAASYDCYQCSVENFNRYAYVMLAGLLGGSLYGIKYLYKVVARGYWNADRRLWRLFSPPLAAGLALATGAFFEAGVFGFSMGENTTAASYFSLGFITGYFSDRAIGKMQEIAETVFGNTHRQHHHPKKK